jgi:beta-N-acetylhexosaminidase
MMMIGFRGMTMNESDHLLRDLQEYHVGGIILFDYDVPTKTPIRNIESKDQVKNLIEEMTSATPTNLLVAVDQEGGRVARLKETRGFFSGRSAADIATLYEINPDSVFSEFRKQASQLHELGFHINFAPVVDVNLNPDNPVIGKIGRSYSADPEQVTVLAELYLKALDEAGLTGVLKHFPGHGSSMNDSHLGVTDVTDTWDPLELLPYRNLISSGEAKAIMSAHVFHADLDSLYPGTLSPYVNKTLLRDELGFDGVLFSDDLQMGAIRDQFTLEETVVLALNSGIDVLVFGNNSEYDSEIAPKVHQIIMDAVSNGEISAERIRESAHRIERLYDSLGK